MNFTSTMLRSPTRWRREAAAYHVIINCDIIRILGHQLFYLTFILIGFIITPRFQSLITLNISRNRQLFHNVSMQIKSPANEILARDQLTAIQHELSGLNNLRSSTATRSSSTVASRFQTLQKLCRMISILSMRLARASSRQRQHCSAKTTANKIPREQPK